MKVTILDAKVVLVRQKLVKPLVLSAGPITELTEAVAHVTVQAGSRRGYGRGSIYLSDVWAWPDPSRAHAERDAALRKLCEHIAGDLWALCGSSPAHPLELGLRLHENICKETHPPPLARAMCASPFDAAIHDAVGQALEVSAFALYEENYPVPSADLFFPHTGVCAAIRHRLQNPPRREFQAWLIVGKNDSFSSDIQPWIRQRGYRCFKIKITGKDNSQDAAQTAEVYRKARASGVHSPRLTVDSNEGNPDAASVLDYLKQLQSLDIGAFEVLEYLEQPTNRDIAAYAQDWHSVVNLKPVMLDEGLTDLKRMEEAVAQGWSGLALKTCKGHSFALVAATWAKERGLLVSLQDLTNPGLALIHAAVFAAYVSTINGVELNSPQFTPAANALWLPRLRALFEPSDGIHRLPERLPAGLATTL